MIICPIWNGSLLCTAKQLEWGRILRCCMGPDLSAFKYQILACDQRLLRDVAWQTSQSLSCMTQIDHSEQCSPIIVRRSLIMRCLMVGLAYPVCYSHS
jgi:hypothetical protein